MSFYDKNVTAGGVTQTLLEFTKSILGITDASKDASLSVNIDIAGRACERYIDNIIAKVEVKEQFKDSFTPIPLRYWPADNLVSVFVDGQDVTADYETVTQDGIFWTLRSLRTLQPTEDTRWKQMDVSYDAGYDPIPEDLAYAIATAGIAYENNVASGGPIKKETVVGVGSVEYDTALQEATSVGMLPASAVGALEPYRRHHV
jgi:hypothetical protein